MSHSSTPYDMLGEMFKLKLNYKTHIITLPTTLKQALLLPDPVYRNSTYKSASETQRENKE